MNKGSLSKTLLTDGLQETPPNDTSHPPQEHLLSGGEECNHSKGDPTANNNTSSSGQESLSQGFKTGSRKSVVATLFALAGGQTESLIAEWKLTRAAVHLEDAWKGRIMLCPSLEDKNALVLFKCRWRLRRLEHFLVHLLLVLTLVEIPLWCNSTGKCFWSCFLDFNNNYYLPQYVIDILQGSTLVFLVAVAALDKSLFGQAYSKMGKSRELYTMWLKHTVLVLYIFDILMAFFFKPSFRLQGYLRLLLYIAAHRRTLLVVVQLRHILAAVLDIWVLILIIIATFTWVGMILFGGSTEGTLYFPDMFEGSWNLLVLFTKTNYPDIMIQALYAARLSVVYFVVFVILAAFFLAPLSLAFIFNVFRGGQQGIPQMEESIHLNSTAEAFWLLDENHTGKLPLSVLGALLMEVYHMRGISFGELCRMQELLEEATERQSTLQDGTEEPAIEIDTFRDAVNILDRNAVHVGWITEVEWFLPKVYHSRWFGDLIWVMKHKRVTVWPGMGCRQPVTVLVFDLLELCMLVASLGFILASSLSNCGAQLCIYDLPQMFLLAGFCFTSISLVAVYGWRNCTQRPEVMYGLVVVFLSVFTFFLMVIGLSEQWGVRVFHSLRIAHVVLLLKWVPRLAGLVQTLFHMMNRATIPASVMFAWFFLMAVLGVQLFGGLVCAPALAEGDQNCDGVYIPSNTYTESKYEVLNFNNTISAIVTLFVLLVVNDWYVIVDEFVQVTGSGWARLYFILNYVIGVAVLLNLITTVVINAFWDEYKSQLVYVARRNPSVASLDGSTGGSTGGGFESAAGRGEWGGGGTGDGGGLMPGSDQVQEWVPRRPFRLWPRAGSSSVRLDRFGSNRSVGGAVGGDGVAAASCRAEEEGGGSVVVEGGEEVGVAPEVERGFGDSTERTGMEWERLLFQMSRQQRRDRTGII